MQFPGKVIDPDIAVTAYIIGYLQTYGIRDQCRIHPDPILAVGWYTSLFSHNIPTAYHRARVVAILIGDGIEHAVITYCNSPGIHRGRLIRA